MNTTKDQSSKAIILFLVLTFALSSIFYYLIINAGTLTQGGGMYVLGLMWCPGIAALITLKVLKRSWKELGWKWGKTRYQLWSYLIPIIYGLIAYLIIWVFGWGQFYNEETVQKVAEAFGLGTMSDGLVIAIYTLGYGILGMIPSSIFALGEEIGWRGFLTPELMKSHGFAKTSIITGFIWGVWHLPLLIFADYNSGTPTWFSLPCFMVLVIAISFIYTWYRMKSGSLWTAVFLHAAHNLFILEIFNPLTKDTGNTAYYVSEFGIVLPIVAIGFAIYYWNKRGELDAA